MKLKPFLLGFGILAVLLTLAPLIAADYWWIRIFDFPHTQLTILTMVALVVYFARFNIRSWKDYSFVAVLTACFVFQLSKIYPYLPHNQYEVGEASEGIHQDNTIRFFAANVLQKNKNSDLLIRELENQNPDIILLTETNGKWKDNLIKATLDFPYKVEIPMDNTYGMLLYSKLPLKNPKINFLVDDSIPSIETIVQLKSGKEIQLFTIHPTPPMPQHNPSSSDRDAEMMIIAKKARDSKLPVIVAGDFNDVAWSSTTGLFKTVGGLLDVRIGRGFYNTFDATSSILRWPLDHFFVTEDFRLVNCKTISGIDSDHFPFYLTLSLEPEHAAMQKPASPTKEQIITANNQIAEARKKQEEKQKKAKKE
ncbi:endonuclease/exonuclease/phosphatase family protein [Salegentibacter sp. F188]|uniref:Endonuclease/exonuclease/phosphatase family protein n=1 Tax=Autumnicola patrickiae TaxID=3075591 RepID=A0ABU3E283_9FLAO|nr:endonuclease/exonuclease/phosphatase family protein [Salegentibacter sp. F188]MDT0690081.1 endonuclease/exonuclease/phosphatase family protein [Salegentibacter sp. F188]